MALAVGASNSQDGMKLVWVADELVACESMEAPMILGRPADVDYAKRRSVPAGQQVGYGGLLRAAICRAVSLIATLDTLSAGFQAPSRL
jgi:hypothetical protein